MSEGKVSLGRRGHRRIGRAAIALALGAGLHCDGGSENSPPPPPGAAESAGALPAASRASSAAPAELMADAGPFGFRRDVYPLLVTYCGECHASNGPYHDAASPELAVAYADAVEYADRLIARVQQGNMPPGCVFDDAACVPAAALDVLERWVSEGMPE